MSLLGRLLGSDKALNTSVKAARDGLDALVYTDEEKANDAAKARSEARGMVVEWLKSTQGQNLSRRIIALTTCAVWLFQYIASLALGIVAVFIGDVDVYDKVIEVRKLFVDSALQMQDAVWLILAFYFAAPHMSSIVGTILSRVKGK